jgi:hypothetical protein
VRCVDGLEWDADRVAANLAGSLAPAVEQGARDGYSAAFAARRDAAP